MVRRERTVLPERNKTWLNMMCLTCPDYGANGKEIIVSIRIVLLIYQAMMVDLVNNSIAL